MGARLSRISTRTKRSKPTRSMDRLGIPHFRITNPFLLDVIPATDAFPVLTTVQRLHGFLDKSQSCETAFVQVVEQVFVMADRGQIAFVFRVLHFDFLRGDSVPVDRLD